MKSIDIVYIEGDGIGASQQDVPGVSALARHVMDVAVERAHHDVRLRWIPALAGELAREQTGFSMPQETRDLIAQHKLALKGPLMTPVGEGFRSLNVFLRQHFDLYSCVRPVKYIDGTPAPNKFAPNVDITVFRENTEDVYAGIEFDPGSLTVRNIVTASPGLSLEKNYGIGIKPISEFGTKRVVRKAIEYALRQGYPSVTLMHKGNIMKATEAKFMEWGYEVAVEEFGDFVVLESELAGETDKLIIKDRIADSMFQQIQLRPEDYSVVATTNLNGDYLSDALAAMVGGLGFAPGANIGEEIAIFEATHGTAPKYTGQDKANPGSMILSGAMLLEHAGLTLAAKSIRFALTEVVRESARRAQVPGQQLLVTYDIARQFDGYSAEDGVKASEFTEAIIERL